MNWRLCQVDSISQGYVQDRDQPALRLCLEQLPALPGACTPDEDAHDAGQDRPTAGSRQRQLGTELASFTPVLLPLASRRGRGR